MRKKSHISLARYIVETMGDENLKKHKLSFYIGSILPDIKPSFLYKRHEINGTYSDLKEHIKRLSEGQKLVETKKTGRKYYMDLGQVTHYLADYFTFPHNEIYEGSLKEHCSYEKKLKDDLKAHIAKLRERRQALVQAEFKNAEKLCEFIKRAHDEYLEEKHDVGHDIVHIIEINQKVMREMLCILMNRRMEEALQYV